MSFRKYGIGNAVYGTVNFLLFEESESSGNNDNSDKCDSHDDFREFCDW
jgi:hypothetical protein